MNSKIAFFTYLILILSLMVVNVKSIKFGVCPQPPAGSFGICVELCQTDETCSGNLKCVSFQIYLLIFE
jgi:hypothetical protein